ncbi:hypothetical protein ACSBR1_035923 [Camellia fascicularis]
MSIGTFSSICFKNLVLVTNGYHGLKKCISSPHIGLRQGDPLSPFLFNLVVKGLNILIQWAKCLNLIKGVDLGGSGLTLSHLQFADDTLMFCNPNWDEITNLKRILSCFELISGLKINYQKSVICGIGINREFTSQVAEFFNCKMKILPINYLGMPLGANPKRVSTWEPIIDKVKKRLASWKKRYLSLGGRITLIKSILSSLPLYYMSIFKIPSKVANLIDKYQRSFLWGDSDDKRKLHLLNWEACSVSKHFGGLGFRKIKEANDALLCKWWWRFATEKSSLWRKVSCAKNNVNGDCWFPNGSSFRHSSAMWKSISSMERYGSKAIALFLENIQFKLSDGKRIKFWFDAWASCTPSSNLYPRLFSLASNKDSCVHQYLHSTENELHHELISRLPQPINLSNNCEDTLLWAPIPSGSFIVKSLHEIFENSLRLNPFPIMKMWKSLAPPKSKLLVGLFGGIELSLRIFLPEGPLFQRLIIVHFVVWIMKMHLTCSCFAIMLGRFGLKLYIGGALSGSLLALYKTCFYGGMVKKSKIWVHSSRKQFH